MSNPLILKLQHAGRLDDMDQTTLEAVCATSRKVGPHQDIIREGDKPDDVHLVIEGVACRYKILPQGDRSIMALLLPGDFCDLHVAILGEMDHGIATVTECTLVEIPRRTILDLTQEHSRIHQALWWATLVDEAVLREWLVNMGQRDADRRTAHLFCEVLRRLQVVGLADADSFEWRITQQELGDIVALSTVHVNRTLQALREQNLIVLKNRRLTIPDVERLMAFAGFTPNYLHLSGQTGRTGPDRDGSRAQP